MSSTRLKLDVRDGLAPGLQTVLILLGPVVIVNCISSLGMQKIKLGKKLLISPHSVRINCKMMPFGFYVVYIKLTTSCWDSMDYSFLFLLLSQA